MNIKESNKNRKNISFSKAQSLFEHRKKYALESGLLYILCEYNDKASSPSFNYDIDCFLTLHNKQDFVFVSSINKYNCKIEYLEVIENKKSLKIYL
jgi:hypothetical protein